MELFILYFWLKLDLILGILGTITFLSGVASLGVAIFTFGVTVEQPHRDDERLVLESILRRLRRTIWSIFIAGTTKFSLSYRI